MRIIVRELGIYGCSSTGKLMLANVVHKCIVMGVLLLMLFLYAANRKLWLAKIWGLRVALKAQCLKQNMNLSDYRRLSNCFQDGIGNISVQNE